MKPTELLRTLARALPCSALVLLTACAATQGQGQGPLMSDPTDTARHATLLAGYLDARAAEVTSIPPGRRDALDGLVAAVTSALRAGDEAEVVFICTHNSRRSQMAQVWARVAAERAGLAGVRTYSGGTEATAFHANAVAALRRAGLTVERGDEATGAGFSSVPNHVHEVTGGPLLDPLACWSKTFGDDANPRSGFIAVMTCSDADEACPIVPGADARVPVTYVDPKVSDGTDAEAATYDERCAQIAREMIYVFDAVAGRGA